jgi:aspartate aminotransferase
MKAQGQDVVGFGAGEPDFDTPQHIKDAAAKALAAGFTKYTPSRGIPELRQAIADKFKRENGLTYKPEQIIVSCGGKHSCYNVIMATCQEGDDVIIPAPYWLSYPEMVKLASAKPVIIETTDATEFKITPDQLRAAITPRARLFILNSPSNPTSFAQKGAVAALIGPQDHLPKWLAEFDRRRRFAWQKLNSIPGITCCNAKGAFYLFPNISKTGLKSTEFCARLL